MQKMRPVYKIVLIAAIVIYVAGVCIIQADLYNKIGKVEHALAHTSGGHGSHHH